jgi:hypothetical protein
VLSHLPPAARKAIVGQLVLYEVLHERRPELHGEGLGAVWDALVGRVKERTRLELGEPQNGQTDAEYLDRLVAGLDGVTPAGAPGKEACAHIRVEARAAVAALQAGDDRLSRDSRTALELTAAFYHDAGIDIPASMLDAVSLEAGWNESRTPHPYASDQQVGGLTILSRRSLDAKVKLILVPSSLDWPTVLAGSYVLLHELISHAFVGPWTVPERAERKADVRFAEGWMDAVAFQVHDETMNGGHALGSFGARFDYQSARQNSARTLHEARYVSGSDDQAYGARDLGRDAAERVLDLFRRLPETEPDPRAALWRLSAALNTSPLPQLDRRELVMALCRSLHPSRLSRAAPVISAVRAWAETRPADNREAWAAALKLAAAIDDL